MICKVLARVRKLILGAISINPFTFIYFNYLKRQVRRIKRKYIIPYWGTRIEFHKKAGILLQGNLVLNANKYPRSRAECYLRLREGATLNITSNVSLNYNATVEVHKGATLKLGTSTIQSGAVIICASKMTIGNGCLIGRMAYISDSDHHKVMDADGHVINYPKEIIIGDNVWIAVRATVMKGSKIKNGALIGADSMVMGRVNANALIMEEPSREFGYAYWTHEGF